MTGRKCFYFNKRSSFFGFYGIGCFSDGINRSLCTKILQSFRLAENQGNNAFVILQQFIRMLQPSVGVEEHTYIGR